MAQHNHSNPKSRPRKRGGSAAPKVGVGREKGMPLASDIRYLETTRLPPPDERRIYRDLPAVISPEMREALLGREVSAFFGTRFSTEKLARLSLTAREAETVRQRMEHGVEIAAQIGAPLLADLYLEVTNLMRDWDLFSQQLPQAADRLRPLAEWWASVHPGNGKSARNDNPAPTPAPLPKPA